LEIFKNFQITSCKDLFFGLNALICVKIRDILTEIFKLEAASTKQPVISPIFENSYLNRYWSYCKTFKQQVVELLLAVVTI